MAQSAPTATAAASPAAAVATNFPEIRQFAIGGTPAEPVNAIDAASPSSIQDGVRAILTKT
ncbi:hypothetical protein RB614_14875 [Phytohabitans sp. ZYX-F-186]|uniref:Uncharacterized protein n=1 Tax=Phytohabitans maris TaxID=3071409 RepID=A0ABU0ZFI7_9ACTN|nr:hypothetical protein [Phytohabitans sp. ZYX-F-186]MDQ7905800.1 hypothetical protein [Phytohabitans sp. ZYX-F-186]